MFGGADGDTATDVSAPGGAEGITGNIGGSSLVVTDDALLESRRC